MVARRTAPLLAAAVLAAALSAAVLVVAAADARKRPATTSVGVGAREYRLTAYRTTVPRGVVRFNLTNYGEDVHDLVVLGRDGREVGRSAAVRAGRRTTLQLRLGPGRYRLVCDIADHEVRGMRAALRVTRAGGR